jgi:hypothetical protein
LFCFPKLNSDWVVICLDYLSGSLTCRTFGKGRNMKVMVKKHDFLKSGSINYGKYDIKHEIYIPDSFMQRVEVYDKGCYFVLA